MNSESVKFKHVERSLDSSQFGDWAMGWTSRCSNPGRVSRFSSSSTRPDQPWGPPGILFSGYRGSLPEVERPAREFGHSSPSDAKSKNE
jgi:hypothetical protein